MNAIRVFAEIGTRRTFVGAIDWPGWCRSGRLEGTALQALIDYGPRYEQVLHGSGIEFRAPTSASDLVVGERHDGNATTDFGAPAIILGADRKALDPTQLKCIRALLLACWRAFDSSVKRATGRELQKGPRGGGRDLASIINHLLEADRAYLGRLAWKHREETGIPPLEELRRTRRAILDALAVATDEGLLERGPRGGILWPPRYFIRRVAWHVLDHAWEIEDRIL
jgi:hypothetical protein